MALTVRYPAEVATDDTRMAYLLRLKGALQREHNAKGALLREKRITQAQWDEWLEKDWQPRSDVCMARYAAARTRIEANDIGIDAKAVFVTEDVREV